MSIRLLRATLLLITLAASPAFSQGLDERQSALIQQTASGICNSVKDAKGTKSTVEIQGDVGE